MDDMKKMFDDAAKDAKARQSSREITALIDGPLAADERNCGQCGHKMKIESKCPKCGWYERNGMVTIGEL